MKNIRISYLKKIPFLVVKFLIYLNRRVFVMIKSSRVIFLSRANISLTLLYAYHILQQGYLLSWANISLLIAIRSYMLMFTAAR